MLSILTANSPGLMASASLSTQQQAQSFGLPLWLWLVVALFIVIIGVIWTLYEEGELGKKKAETEPPAATSTRAGEVFSTPDAEPTAADKAAAAPADQAVSSALSDTKAESALAPEASAPAEAVSVSEVSTAVEESEEVTAPEANLVEAAIPAPPARPDNLKRVKGIGPKTEQLLKARGLTTFAQLAETEVSRIQAILDEADYTLADPESWPEQARQLAEAQAKK